MDVNLVIFHVCIVKVCDTHILRTDWYILCDMSRNKPCVIWHKK